MQIYPFYVLGLLVGRTPGVLWIHHVGYPNDHWKETTRRQRLHRSFSRPFHWLYADLQKNHDSFDAKGKKSFKKNPLKYASIIWIIISCLSKGAQGNFIPTVLFYELCILKEYILQEQGDKNKKRRWRAKEDQFFCCEKTLEKNKIIKNKIIFRCWMW